MISEKVHGTLTEEVEEFLWNFLLWLMVIETFTKHHSSFYLRCFSSSLKFYLFFIFYFDGRHDSTVHNKNRQRKNLGFDDLYPLKDVLET